MRLVPLTDSIATSEQIQPGDMPAIADAGYRRVVNNRPDGEDPGQPDNATLAAAAAAAGLEYFFLPVTAMDFPGAPLGEVAEVFDDGDGPVLAFCRSGTRSANLWIASRPRAEREAAMARAHSLGYDISMAARVVG